MRRWVFVVAVFGMVVLVFLLNKSPIEINDVKDLENFEINTRVSVSGKVLSERTLYKNTKLLSLDKKLDLICECSESLINKTVRLEGRVEKYDEKKQVRVLEIEILD